MNCSAPLSRLHLQVNLKCGILMVFRLLGDEAMRYSDAPTWDKRKCPSLDPHAVPLDAEVVHGRRVIHVKGAMYRNAVFDGTFLLSNTVVLPFKKDNKQRVKVRCCWYGHRLLAKNEPKFLIDMATAVADENYDGDVITNLGKRPL